MPCQIFDIDGLLRLVVDESVATSPRSAVAFAVTCQAFEEPTLGSLRKEQHSLTHLVEVLPNHTKVRDEHGSAITVTEDEPSAEDWVRLHRYAPWTRNLDLAYRMSVTTETLRRLSSNSPDGLLCPKLEKLHRQSVDYTHTTLPFFRIFLSPRLKCVLLHTGSYLPGTMSDVSWGQLAASFLPIPLEELSVMCSVEKEGPLKGTKPSVCCCGTSLRGFAEIPRMPHGNPRRFNLLASIVRFHNLVKLRVHIFCGDANGCSFWMMDSNVNDLAIAFASFKGLETRGALSSQFLQDIVSCRYPSTA